MYSIKITTEAETDLSEIYEYISSVLKNPIAADNILNEIENSFKALVDNPEMYSVQRYSFKTTRLQKDCYKKLSDILQDRHCNKHHLHYAYYLRKTRIHRYYIADQLNFCAQHFPKCSAKLKIAS